MIVSAHPASTRGTYRDRHGRWARDAVDAWDAQRAFRAPTKASWRTAKPCGPDPPTLGSSLRDDVRKRRWLESPAHRGEHGAAVNTIARGMSVVPAEPVVTAACVFCCRRAMGAASIRHSPRPLDFEGRNQRITRADHAAGMRTCVFRHCEERKRRSNPYLRLRRHGLLRGACHRARVRATRWLAMTRRGRRRVGKAGHDRCSIRERRNKRAHHPCFAVDRWWARRRQRLCPPYRLRAQ